MRREVLLLWENEGDDAQSSPPSLGEIGRMRRRVVLLSPVNVVRMLRKVVPFLSPFFGRMPRV